MAHKRKDILWKSMIEEFSEDFLRFFYSNADELFNFNTRIEFLDKELEQLAPDATYMKDSATADKLLKVATFLQGIDWLLLLVEVQGQKKNDFPERLYTYHYRLTDKYGKKVMALAIYTDEIKGYCPSVYEYSLVEIKGSFHFKTYKVLAQEEEALANHDNPFSLIVLTVLFAIRHSIKGDENSLLEAKIKLVKNLKKRTLEAEKEAKLLTFIRLYVDFEKPETNRKFEEAIHQLFNKTNYMGIIEYAIQDAVEKAVQEAVQEAVAETRLETQVETELKEKLEVIRLMLAEGDTLDKIARVTRLSIYEVQQLIK
jgi:predicted transposase/invertase (TIGR01784 family)